MYEEKMSGQNNKEEDRKLYMGRQQSCVDINGKNTNVLRFIYMMLFFLGISLLAGIAGTLLVGMTIDIVLLVFTIGLLIVIFILLCDIGFKIFVKN